MSELILKRVHIVFDSEMNESSFRDCFGIPIVTVMDTSKTGLWFQLEPLMENHDRPKGRFFIPWNHVIALRSVEG